MWITVSVVAAAAAAAAWFVAGRMHHFAYWIDRKSDAEVAALASGRWRVERLEVEPGVSLVGLVRPPTADDGRWVLFVPGNSTALLAGFQAELERTLPEEVGVAFWAYRGFEASDGVPTPAALLDDLLRQWHFVEQRNRAPTPPEIFGYSLGVPLAVRLVARLADSGKAPARLVLAAAGPRIDVMKHGVLGRFRPDDVYDATGAAGAVDCPTIIVHGSDDDALPVAGARELQRLIGANAQFIEAQGKGHTDIWEAVKATAF